MNAPGEITDPMKANWAVAYVLQERTKRLSPALRRAYTQESFGVPDLAALNEAIAAAHSIHATLLRAAELLTGEHQPTLDRIRSQAQPPKRGGANNPEDAAA